MKIITNSFAFQEGNDYLDVEVHEAEKWIELKIETSESFPIQSREDLDMIYHKLCEVFDEFKKDKKTDYKKLHKDYKG
jgi:2-oxoglutarate dehydrogenase complex dehydrogenase (E1) component-like enzyme